MQLSHIYISDGNHKPSAYMLDCIETTKRIFPQMKHVLYGWEDGRAFIATHYGNEVLSAFDKLNPFAYKADLLRYCIIYQIGGWYFDIGVKPIKSINISEDLQSLAFKDMPTVTHYWACSNAVLYSKPRNEVYSKAIEMVVNNCKNKYYGINPLCPTGPILLAKAFSQAGGESPLRIFGDFLFLTPMHANKNPAFVLPSGDIFAMGKPSKGGDLIGIGGRGSNNYNEFFHSKNVYRE